nr:DEAD/DEAH box helicase [Sphingobium lignivorans]
MDPALAAAGLVVPPWVIDRRDIPVHPALLLDIGLRDYQWNLLLRIAAAMRAGYRRILVVAPTGAGKTVLASALMMSAATLGLTSEFIVHRKELIKQTSRSFTERGLEHGFVTAETAFGFNPQQITLAGVQTLVTRLRDLFPPNLVILDEAHHAVAGTWEQVLEAYAGAFIIGLTATPQRLDGRGLGAQFDILIEGPTVAELIQRGFLSRYQYFAFVADDMKGVSATQAEEKAERPKLIGDMVEHYQRLAAGEQGIIFGQNRAHSLKIAQMFNAAGIKAMHVDGSMSQKERDYFDDAFRARDITIGCNVNLFGEGYDVPGITYLGIGAVTRSLVNHKQWCGRVLRPDGTIATICDHVGNALPVALGGRGLGLPDDDVEWSLEGGARLKTGVSDDAISITQCLDCYRIYPSSAPQCPGCGDVRRVKTRAHIQQEAGILTKLEREELKKREAARRKDEERSVTSFEQMASLGPRARLHQPTRMGVAAVQIPPHRHPRKLENDQCPVKNPS